MSFQAFSINLTGVEPLAAARGSLPEGGIRVRTGVPTVERGKSDPSKTNLVVPVIITGEGELEGERSVYLTLPNGQDAEKDQFFARKIAAFLRSIGIQNTNGQIQLSPELLANKGAFIQVTHSKGEDGKENENVRFISADEYQRLHWRKRADSTPNGKGAHTPALTAPIPMAGAPQLPAMAPVAAAPQTGAPVGYPGVAVPGSPAVGVPQAGAPVAPGVPGNVGQFFNAPAQ